MKNFLSAKNAFMLPAIIILTVWGFSFSSKTSSGGIKFLSDSSANAMRWRLVGPFRAGRALAAEGISSQPETFYFGSVDGGIWKSSNAGLTWEPVSDGQVSPSIGALAISSSDPDILYAGTGEADMRSDMTYGEGVYKSTDGGKNWTHIGLEDTRHIGKILIDPKNPKIVLAAALGHAYAPNSDRGVFKTTDGGRSWKKVLFKNDKTGAIDLTCDPDDPSVIYASLWAAYRTPWSQYPPVEEKGSGIYKSTDEGSTWMQIKGGGLPDGLLGRIGLSAVKGSHGEKIYALVQALGKGSGLYFTSDGGATWKLRSDNPQIITRMWYFGRVFVDPKNENTVYIPNRSIFRSTDGGKTFTAIKGSPGGDDYHYLWIDPQNDKHLIVASDQGTAVSLDYGLTWSSWYNQPTAQFYHVITDNQFPYRIYGAQQDAGTVSITSRSDYGEITFRDWYSVNSGESGYIAPDPKNPNIIYGGGTYGSISRFDRITGQTQNITPWLLTSFGQPMSKMKYRFTWTSPIGFDFHKSPSLYFGAQVLLKTEDGGLHWKEASPDLTGAKPADKSDSSPLTIDNAAARGHGVIYSFAFSKIRPGIIWAGTDDGFVQLTKDNGRHWLNVTPSGLKAWSKISSLDASRFNAGTVYAAVDRHRLDDLTPYIYKTDDYGKHWTEIGKGISYGAFVRVVRADPEKRGLLYAGTEKGVYFSLDDGINWQPLQLNLPEVSVRDLDVHGNDLVAATHGRAFWVLDDLTSLRQMSGKVLDSDAYLFKPEEAVRIRRDEDHDTPLPPEIPHGENPPAGAVINYYLNSKPDEPVTLKIADMQGNLVREYSSGDRPDSIKTQLYFMTYWLPEFKPLTIHQGLNRFVWDLRYPAPPAEGYHYSIAAVAGKGTIREPQGPLVLPGKYKVTLLVNGRSYSQILTVKMDPRVNVSVSQLKDQLRLGLKIWNAAADRQYLQTVLNGVENQLTLIAGDKRMGTEITDLSSELAETLKKIDDSLKGIGFANFESAVFGADREPTQQMKEAYRINHKKFEAVKSAWENFNKSDLERFNRLLLKRGIQSIIIPLDNVKLLKADI